MSSSIRRLRLAKPWLGRVHPINAARFQTEQSFSDDHQETRQAEALDASGRAQLTHYVASGHFNASRSSDDDDDGCRAG
jgi:hypothetical protein